MDRQQLEQNQRTEELRSAGAYEAEKKKGVGRGILYGVIGTLLAGALLLIVAGRAAGVKILVTNGSTKVRSAQ